MKFEIGEVAVLCKSYVNPERVGEECEIIDINVLSSVREPYDYAIRYKNIPGHYISGHWCVNENQLRKKKPPEEEIDWVEKLGLENWNPTKQGVEI